jgi:hypothetical protein
MLRGSEIRPPARFNRQSKRRRMAYTTVILRRGRDLKPAGNCDHSRSSGCFGLVRLDRLDREASQLHHMARTMSSYGRGALCCRAVKDTVKKEQSIKRLAALRVIKGHFTERFKSLTVCAGLLAGSRSLSESATSRASNRIVRGTCSSRLARPATADNCTPAVFSPGLQGIQG